MDYLQISFGCWDSLAEFSCFGSGSQKGSELLCRVLHPFTRFQSRQCRSGQLQCLPPSLGLLSPFPLSQCWLPRGFLQGLAASLCLKVHGGQGLFLFLFLPALPGEQRCWWPLGWGFTGDLRIPAHMHHSQSQIDPGVSHLSGLLSWSVSKLWVP